MAAKVRKRGEVRVSLAATGESLRRVRHALGGFAEALDADPRVVANLQLAVTEACSNVVVHAYDGEIGTLEVEGRSDDGELAVWVRDFGRGLTNPTPAPGLGLGMPLIASLSESFEAYPGFLRGTTVVMRFSLAGPARDGLADTAR